MVDMPEGPDGHVYCYMPSAFWHYWFRRGHAVQAAVKTVLDRGEDPILGMLPICVSKLRAELTADKLGSHARVHPGFAAWVLDHHSLAELDARYRLAPARYRTDLYEMWLCKDTR